jgi:hypothetical protein
MSALSNTPSADPAPRQKPARATSAARLSSAPPRRSPAVLELVNGTIDELVSLDAVHDALAAMLIAYYRAGRLESGRRTG